MATTQKFVTLPAGTTRTHPHMAGPILDQNNVVTGFTASGGDTYPLATYALDSSGNVTGLVGPSGVQIAGLSTLKDKVRLSLVTQKTKPWESSFWNAPTVWTSGQAVYGGECRSSNGNWYIALASGTCGSNAPSGVQPAIGTTYFSAWYDGAADGSAGGVGWVYFSKVLATYTGDVNTTVSVGFSSTTDATCSQILTPATGTWGSPTGYIRDTNTNSTKQYIPTGGGASISIASWVGDLIKSTNAGYVRASQTPGGTIGITATQFVYNAAGNETPAEWELNTDSPKIQFTTSGYDTGLIASTGGGARVFIDDVEVQPGAFFQSLGTNNGSTYTLITLTGPAKIRNVKLIGVNSIRDIRILPNYSLYKVKDNTLKILQIGDSISAGSAIGPSRSIMSWPQIVSNELGCRYGATNASTGGSGVETNGGGVNFITRLTTSTNTNNFPSNSLTFQEANSQFDIVFVQVSFNDSAVSSTLQASYLTLFQTVRALQPNTLIIVHGPWSGSSSIVTNADAVNIKALAAFAQWGDVKSYYIHTRADASEGQWMNSVGYSASGQVNAVGNSSLYVGSDGTHPNDAGILWFAKQTVKQVLQLLVI